MIGRYRIEHHVREPSVRRLAEGATDLSHHRHHRGHGGRHNSRVPRGASAWVLVAAIVEVLAALFEIALILPLVIIGCFVLYQILTI